MNSLTIHNNGTIAEQGKQVLSSVCTCEMPAKIKGKNQCWRCKKPFKEFLQTDVKPLVICRCYICNKEITDEKDKL